VVQLHNPQNENINMNQIFSGIDIDIEAGNPDAIGIEARAAQGTSVQDVTIKAGTAASPAAVGLSGGAGSGGSHIKVTVIGGKIGVKLGSAQPAPTATGLVLVNQTEVAIDYSSPGRQTLSLVGIDITMSPTAQGPAVRAGRSVSMADSVIRRLPTADEGSGGISSPAPPSSTDAAITADATLFLSNVWIQGYDTAVSFTDKDASVAGAGKDSSDFVHVELLAKGSMGADKDGMVAPLPGLPTDVLMPVIVNGTRSLKQLVRSAVVPHSSAPAAGSLTASHVWDSSTFPSFEAKTGVCNVKSAKYGAKGDLTTDDTASLQEAMDDTRCAVVFLPKGYYAVTKTLQMRPNTSLIGVSRLLSNIVPHSSVAPHVFEAARPRPRSSAVTKKTPNGRLSRAAGAAWPLLQTAAGATDASTVAWLSVIVWHHGEWARRTVCNTRPLVLHRAWVQ
jgi:hypothetical protein